MDLGTDTETTKLPTFFAGFLASDSQRGIFPPCMCLLYLIGTMTFLRLPGIITLLFTMVLLTLGTGLSVGARDFRPAISLFGISSEEGRKPPRITEPANIAQKVAGMFFLRCGRLLTESARYAIYWYYPSYHSEACYLFCSAYGRCAGLTITLLHFPVEFRLIFLEEDWVASR